MSVCLTCGYAHNGNCIVTHTMTGYVAPSSGTAFPWGAGTNSLGYTPYPLQIGKIALRDGAIFPVFGTPQSVGFDLAICEDVTLGPGRHKLAPTGLIIVPPEGYWLMIVGRSSLIKRGLMLGNCIGIIDPDYVGQDDEIRLSLYNVSEEVVHVNKGERLAQGIFMALAPKATLQMVERDSLPSKSRGGFGSTG